jgi:CubicO group peptidase (beta-lactamase class C family)
MPRQFLTNMIVVFLMLFLAACAPISVSKTGLVATPNATREVTLSVPTSVTTVSIGDQNTDTPEAEGVSNDLDSIFQKLTNTGDFSGSVLVARNGAVVLDKSYGLADRQKNIPITPQTKFPIGSITKQFTAMAVLMLQEQGKLNVQDGICNYLEKCPEAWKPVTIHQLLTHTSGIPDPLEAFWTQDISSPAPLEQMIADAAAKPLEFQPGAKFSYNNTGYDLLGKIIENVSSQTYGIFLQEHIFQPLSMSNTSFDPNQHDLAIGYKDQTGKIANPFNLWVAFSAGALYSTVEDLYLWDQALYTEKLAPQKDLDTMFTPYTSLPDTGGMGYGYGWTIGTDHQHRFVGHEGLAYGYRSLILRYPDDHVTIIILSNQENVDPSIIASSIANKLFGQE